MLDNPDHLRVAGALTTRFKSGSVYTSIGEVLLSINPYKSLLLPGSSKGYYEDSVIDSYRGRNRGDLPPHIFRIAEDAHSSLVRTQQNVSVIVSGESGAGKTEACRQLLNYLTRASNGIAKSKAASTTSTTSSSSPAQLVRDRLITSSTLLEAFGNAATVRNDNSSRYGKLMRISFTPSGVARGGSCQVYLLEKHRVVSILEDMTGDVPLERSFHVLYQLAAGATPEMRKELHLATAYRIRGGSNRTARTIAGVNDARNFSGLVACFKILAVSASVQKDVFRALSIVLNLGELDFIDASPESHSDSALIDDEPGSTSSTAFAALASLIGCDKKAIESALTQRTIKIRTERTQVMLNKKLATASRNALAKTLYERIFLHIVDLINETCDSASVSVPREEVTSSSLLLPSSPSSSTPSPSPPPSSDLGIVPICEYNTISLLDIYGFESFDKPLENRFDQLLVNFCNERLQDLFICSTLVAEQQVYESEGIPWTPIAVFDTKATIDLISGKKGIFPVLDDATRLPTSTLLAADSASARSNHNDDTGDMDAEEAVEAADEKEKEAIASALLEKLNRAIHSNALFRASKHRGGGFIVSHFAGEVRYSCDDLLEANRDAARIDHDNLFLSNAATSPFLKALFSPVDITNNTLNHASMRKQMKTSSGKKKGSVSHEFSISINELILTLTQSSLCYVRTIKPNVMKTPMGVDDEVLESQIKYLGLVENIAVRRAGYALRLPFDEFFNRYRQLSSSTWPPSKAGDAADMTNEVRKLIEALNLRPRPTAVLILNNKMNGNAKTGVAKLVTAPPPRTLPVIAASASTSPPLRVSLTTPVTSSLIVSVNTSAVLPPVVAQPSSSSSSAAASASTVAPPSPPLTSGLVGDVVIPGSYKLTEGVDVVFGSTMLFVREAKHLFDLEHLRQLGLGYQQTIVARLWRSHSQRRNYLRILSSFKILITRAKGRCLRNRFIKMKKASIHLQAIVRGHIMRRRHADIREAVGLVRYLGKQRRSVSIRWPKPPHGYGDFLGILSSPPLPFFTPIFGMKAAHSLLNVVRKRGVSPLASSTTIASLPQLITFVDNVLKVKPAKSWLMRRRTIIVCSGLLICFKHPLIQGKISRVILLSDLSSVSLSPFCDSFVTLHVKNEAKSFSAYSESKVSLLKALPSSVPVNIATNWILRGRSGEKTPLYSIVFSEVTPSSSSPPLLLPTLDSAASFNALFAALSALPGGAVAGGGRPEVPLQVDHSVNVAAAAAAAAVTAGETPSTTATTTSSTTAAMPTQSSSLPHASSSSTSTSSGLGFFHAVDSSNPHRLAVTVSASRKKTLAELLTEEEKASLRSRKLWAPKA